MANFFLNSSLENQHFNLEQKEKSVLNFKMFTVDCSERYDIKSHVFSIRVRETILSKWE